jgi:hypothetical protein
LNKEFFFIKEAHDTPQKSLRDRNNQVLERSYIGRCFKNDTELMEKLFELYTKMTRSVQNAKIRLIP